MPENTQGDTQEGGGLRLVWKIEGNPPESERVHSVKEAVRMVKMRGTFEGRRLGSHEYDLMELTTAPSPPHPPETLVVRPWRGEGGHDFSAEVGKGRPARMMPKNERADEDPYEGLMTEAAEASASAQEAREALRDQSKRNEVLQRVLDSELERSADLEIRMEDVIKENAELEETVGNMELQGQDLRDEVENLKKELKKEGEFLRATAATLFQERWGRQKEKAFQDAAQAAQRAQDAIREHWVYEYEPREEEPERLRPAQMNARLRYAASCHETENHSGWVLTTRDGLREHWQLRTHDRDSNPMAAIFFELVSRTEL